MPLQPLTFAANDTRLICYQDTVYKVKLDCQLNRTSITSGGNPVEEVENAVRCLIHKQVQLPVCLQTTNLWLQCTSKPWVVSHQLGFRQHGQILHGHSEQFTITIRQRDDLQCEGPDETTSRKALPHPGKDGQARVSSCHDKAHSGSPTEEISHAKTSAIRKVVSQGKSILRSSSKFEQVHCNEVSLSDELEREQECGVIQSQLNSCTNDHNTTLSSDKTGRAVCHQNVSTPDDGRMLSHHLSGPQSEENVSSHSSPSEESDIVEKPSRKCHLLRHKSGAKQISSSSSSSSSHNLPQRMKFPRRKRRKPDKRKKLTILNPEPTTGGERNERTVTMGDQPRGLPSSSNTCTLRHRNKRPGHAHDADRNGISSQKSHNVDVHHLEPSNSSSLLESSQNSRQSHDLPRCRDDSYHAKNPHAVMTTGTVRAKPGKHQETLPSQEARCSRSEQTAALRVINGLRPSNGCSSLPEGRRPITQKLSRELNAVPGTKNLDQNHNQKLPLKNDHELLQGNATRKQSHGSMDQEGGVSDQLRGSVIETSEMHASSPGHNQGMSVSSAERISRRPVCEISPRTREERTSSAQPPVSHGEESTSLQQRMALNRASGLVGSTDGPRRMYWADIGAPSTRSTSREALCYQRDRTLIQQEEMDEESKLQQMAQAVSASECSWHHDGLRSEDDGTTSRRKWPSHKAQNKKVKRLRQDGYRRKRRRSSLEIAWDYLTYPIRKVLRI